MSKSCQCGGPLTAERQSRALQRLRGLMGAEPPDGRSILHTCALDNRFSRSDRTSTPERTLALE
ncbi:hypothetical protein EYF80_015673 [Liparis tanakae]|uniref:Uncharacterized protein n=1 Tax=Liparis tanakae TaxID=230148 RepID=A0A4Z2I9F5_9TELE|nr:hypothetical protein EYF80_015673 [Liparis tanakae]